MKKDDGSCVSINGGNKLKPIIGYLDSNLFIKYYRESEKGHKESKEFIDTHYGYLYISPITLGEVINVLKNRKDIPKNDLEKIVRDISIKVSSNNLKIAWVSYSESLKIHEMVNHYLNTYPKLLKSPTDAFHLATIHFQIKGPTAPWRPYIATSDKDFAIILKKEGYPVFNPEESSWKEFTEEYYEGE